MIQKDIHWLSKDSINLFAHTWSPDSNSKAVIVLIHGFGEHCLRYTPYINFFINENISVLGFDLQGHGQTKGNRGVIKSYNSVLDDIDMALSKAEELFPKIPKILYGHSMGGNLVSNYLIRRKPKLAGAIITSPWLKLSNEPNFILKALVSILSKITPNITTDSKLDTKYISTVEDEVLKYKTDPLNHSRISFLLFNEIKNRGVFAIKNSSQINIPVLVMHGTDDNITSPTASQQMYINNKRLLEYKTWKNCYHELHNELIREELAKYVIDWINKKL